jgi:hypothetical protein
VIVAETTQSTCPHCGQAQPARAELADVTPEKFAGMTAGQRNELLQANPDLYRKLAGR